MFDAEACSRVLQSLHQNAAPLSQTEILQLSSSIAYNAKPKNTEQQAKERYRALPIDVGYEDPLPTPPARENAVVEHFDADFQREAFQFVKSDHRIETTMPVSVPWIPIQSVSRRFFSHQLYAAFWLLVNERSVMRGAILGDSMGLGKTYTALLYLLLNIFVVQNRAHIKQHPERHCNKFSSPQQRCPSWSAFPIECGCQPSSVIQRLGLYDIPGTSIVLVPASLVPTWAQEWEKLGLDQKLGVRLGVQHHNFTERSLSDQELLRLTLTRAADHYSYTLNDTDVLLASQTVILTSVESYTHQLQERLAAMPKRRRLLAVARLLRDESHMTVSPYTRFTSIIRRLAASPWRKPNFVAMTGTPTMRNGFADLHTTISLINALSEGSGNSKMVKRFMDELELTQLEVDYNESCNTKPEDPERVKVAERLVFLLYTYCIRRHAYSRQNGRQLVEIPPLKRFTVYCHCHKFEEVRYESEVRLLTDNPHPEVIRLLAQNRRVEIPTEYLLESVHRPRVVAIVPALAVLCTREMLKVSYLESHGWQEDHSHSFFNHNLHRLERTSGKMQYLRRCLEIWRDYKDWRGNPEALVIMSEFPVICHIVICLLRDMKIHCEWMHSSLGSGKKQELVDRFQDPAQHSKDRLRVLVGTYEIMGQGITLNAAHRAIVMEVSPHAAVEAQCGDRVHRYGSETDTCFLYRLTNPAFKQETLYIKEQRQQVAFQTQIEWARTLDRRYKEYLDSIDRVPHSSGTMDQDIIMQDAW